MIKITLTENPEGVRLYCSATINCYRGVGVQFVILDESLRELKELNSTFVSV